MYFRIGVLKYFTMFTGNHLCWSLFLTFLINVQAWRPATLLKIDSNIDFFLWNLQNFYEHLSLQTTSSGCFWKYLMNTLFTAFENNEWCHFVVRMDPPALISFYCLFRFFLFLSFFSYFFSRILLLFGSEVSFSILSCQY